MESNNSMPELMSVNVKTIISLYKNQEYFDVLHESITMDIDGRSIKVGNFYTGTIIIGRKTWTATVRHKYTCMVVAFRDHGHYLIATGFDGGSEDSYVVENLYIGRNK